MSRPFRLKEGQSRARSFGRLKQLSAYWADRHRQLRASGRHWFQYRRDDEAGHAVFELIYAQPKDGAWAHPVILQLVVREQHARAAENEIWRQWLSQDTN